MSSVIKTLMRPHQGHTSFSSPPPVSSPPTQSQSGVPSKFPDFSADPLGLRVGGLVASGTSPARGPVERPVLGRDGVNMSNMSQEQRSYLHSLQSRLQVIDNQILVLRERRAHLQRLREHFARRR